MKAKTGSQNQLLKAYGKYVVSLVIFNRTEACERDLIIDFISTVSNIARRANVLPADDEENLEPVAETDQTQEKSMSQETTTSSIRANLNELVVKPSNFDGYKSKAREWIDEYGDAFIANDWTEPMAIKYFPTFLRGPACDWFVTMIRLKLGEVTTWSDPRANFYSLHRQNRVEAIKETTESTQPRHTGASYKLYSKSL